MCVCVCMFMSVSCVCMQFCKFTKELFILQQFLPYITFILTYLHNDQNCKSVFHSVLHILYILYTHIKHCRKKGTYLASFSLQTESFIFVKINNRSDNIRLPFYSVTTRRCRRYLNFWGKTVHALCVSFMCLTRDYVQI